MIVAFNARDSRHAFVTPSVKGVETITADDYLAPDKLAREEEFVVGGFKKDGLIIILDPERLIRKGK
jgi:chemotaxis signal transduction protein